MQVRIASVPLDHQLQKTGLLFINWSHVSTGWGVRLTTAKCTAQAQVAPRLCTVSDHALTIAGHVIEVKLKESQPQVHFHNGNWAHGVVVSHPLRMRKALGSLPIVSILERCVAPKRCSCFIRNGSAKHLWPSGYDVSPTR